MKNSILKKTICLVVSAALLAGYLPAGVFAVDLSQQGLCEHHPEHIGCGYIAAAAGAECTHIHDDLCYQVECTHVHGDCSYAAAVEGTDCGHQHDDACGYVEGEAPCGHVHGDCGYVEGTPEIPCDHICTAETCGEKILICDHAHDAECGYAAAVEAVACDYVCEECSAVSTSAPVAEEEPSEELPEEPTEKPSDEASGEIEGGNLSWKLTADGTLTISGEGKMAEFGYNNIRPWDDYVSYITAVVIEDGVTSVSSNAFADCFNLKSAVIADSVTTLGSSLFSGCKLLSSVTLPAGLTEIPGSLFSSCSSLVSVRIPDTVTVIGSRAFSGCTALQNINLPDGLKTIEASAFSSCQSLTNVDFPDGLESIGGDAFIHCEKLTAALIPDSVKTLSSWAFYYCTSLKEVKLPNGITQINNGTFSGCDALEEILIPASVTTIWGSAFNYCESLKKITFAGKAPGIYENAFNNVTADAYYPENYASWTAEKLQNYGGTLTWKTYDNGITEEELDATTIIASGVCGDSMGWALYANGKLHITGSGAMTEYPSAEDTPWAEYTEDVKSVVVEEGVQTISPNAFSGQENLEEVTLPSTLEKLPESVFQDCTSLEEIKIPENVDSIGENAFAGCDSLNKVEFEGNAPSDVADNAFQGVDADVYVPAGNDTWTDEKQNDFGGKLNWSEAVPEEVEASGTWGDNLTWTLDKAGLLTISGTGGMIESKNGLGYPWYEWSSHVRNIYIADGVTSIGINAFTSRMENLASIKIGKDVANIEPFINAFEAYYVVDDNKHYSSVDGILFNKDQTTIIRYPSKKTASSYDIPDSVTEIADFTFTFCDNLTSVRIPDGVNTIGSQAFFECRNLKTIEIPNSVTTLTGTCTFDGCTSLDTIVLPDGISMIPHNAFTDCVSLKSITIPSTVTFVGEWAFSGCEALEFVKFSGNAPTFEKECFLNTESIAYYPADDSTWTTDVLQNYGGNITWVAYDGPESSTSGICGDNLTWEFDADTGKLTIAGYGAMYDFGWDTAPWFGYREDILTIELPEGLTTIGVCAFTACVNLSSINLPETLTTISDHAFEECHSLTSLTIPGSVKHIGIYTFSGAGLTELTLSEGLETIDMYAFMSCFNLKKVELPDSLKSLGGGAFQYCTALETAKLPQTLNTVSWHAFNECTSLQEMTIPKSVTEISYFAFNACTSMSSVEFEGAAPYVEPHALKPFEGVSADAWYPADELSWTDEAMQSMGGDLTWIPNGIVKNCIILDSTELEGAGTVWIDGVEYPVSYRGGSGYVRLPDGKAKTMVIHSYHVDDPGDVHTQYPVGMKVWTLANKDGAYTATRQESFDDILQYSGMSIRVYGKKGIRMITSIDQNKKNALTGSGLKGYTLVEYGTVIAWADQLGEGNPLVLGKGYARSNYAYKRGVADPVFAYQGNLMQYTNVLVNFTNEQCKDDIAMRPYMVLKDAGGNHITIYGGIVTRSIGYIAYQNRNVFEPGTEEYEYVWEIIHYVYGSRYDDEYRVAWTPPAM